MERSVKIQRVLTVAVALTAVGALSACTGGSAPANDDGTVSGTLTGFYDIGYKEGLDEIIANFEAKYPDVKVEMNYQGGDINPLISAQLQAGTAPDLLLAYPGGTPGSTAYPGVVTLASQNRLMPVSDATWTSEVPDAWRDGVIDYEGETYGYPGAVQPLAAIYNQNTLDDLGLEVPTTLDEVLTLCADAEAAGVYAYAQGLGEVAAGPQMLSFAQTASLIYGPNPGFDAEVVDGSATYSDSPWVDQFGIYKEMFDQGCFGDGALGRTRQQGAEAVASGQALAQVDVGGQKAQMQEVAPDARFLIAAIPATNDGDNYITALPGYAMAVNAQAKNPTAAKAFLDFLAEPEQSVIYAEMFSSVPIIPNDKFEAPADLADFAELVASGSYAKLANLTSESQVALNEGVQALLLGNASPSDVAERMQSASE